MNDNSSPPVVGASSFIERLTNVLVAPGEAFDALKSAPVQAVNWVVPLLLGIIAGVVFCVVAFSQPVIVDEVVRQQMEGIDRAVAAGKMTEEAGEKAREQMDGIRPMMGMWAMIFGSLGAAVFSVALLFLVAAVLAAVAHWIFQMPVSYGKWLEVAGLASLVPTLGGLVTLCLVLLKGTLAASPGPALLFPDLKTGTPLQSLLSSLSVFNFWWCAVLGVGLSRLTGRSFGAAAVWVFGIFLVIAGGMAGLSVLWT